MTLRHFRIFLKVCERGSMTAAAEDLGMSQPPVSQCIAELELHYGQRLFERLGRSIRISASGEILRGYATEVLRLVDEAERGLLDLQDSGSLRVGASMTVGTAFLPPVLEELRAAQPRLHLRVVVDNTALVIAKLQNAELDIAFVEGISEWPGMVTEVLYDDELCLICGPDDELGRSGTKLGAELLEGRRFIVREEGSGTREAFVSAMAETGLAWEEAGVVNGAEAIIELVSHGLGISFVSRLLAASAIAAGRVLALPLRDFSIHRKFRLVRRRDKQPSDTMTAFVEACRRRVGSPGPARARGLVPPGPPV